MSRFPKRVVLVAGLGLCLIPVAAALCWRPIALRYHLYHLSHGPCAYRDAAFRYLLAWNGVKSEEDLKVDEVAVLLQEDGRSMLAVFEPDDGDSEVGEKQVWLFDHEAELIQMGEVPSDGFKDLTGDGTVELVLDFFGTTDDDRDLRVFCVLSANQIARPLLIVCCAGTGTEWWSCHPRPRGSTGIHDIEIGKGSGEDFVPNLTYRWSVEARAYVGPKGGGGEPHVRFDSWEELETFASAPGAFQPSRTPGEGTGPTERKDAR